MAYGFGSTFGTGSTDKIETGLTSHATQRTEAAWFWINGLGGGSAGALWAKGTLNPRLNLTNSGGTKIQYNIQGTVANNVWTVTNTISSNAWHHVAVEYDNSAIGNDPVIWIDGANAAFTQTFNGSGSCVTDANTYNIGNRSDGNRNWDGIVAEFAVWDRFLTGDERGALAKGFCPAWMPFARVEYVPLIRSTFGQKGAVTVTGALVVDHPRTILRPPRFYSIPASLGAFTLSAELGSYALTGTAAGVLADRLISADPGDYALTGQDASTLAGRLIAAAAGVYTLTGAAANLVYSAVQATSRYMYTRKRRR